METIDLTLGSTNLGAIAPESIVDIEYWLGFQYHDIPYISFKNSQLLLNFSLLVKDKEDSKVIVLLRVPLREFIKKYLNLRFSINESSIPALAKKLSKKRDLLTFFLSRSIRSEMLFTIERITHFFDTSGYTYICDSTVSGVVALIRELGRKNLSIAANPDPDWY